MAEVERLKNRLHAENVYLQEEIRREHNFEEIVGSSPALLAVLQQVERIAPTDSTVLILGETGTGKELIARAIADRSTRKNRPLVKVNCGAISAGLVESELFGHVKGAFTGALDKRMGRNPQPASEYAPQPFEKNGHSASQGLNSTYYPRTTHENS
jgi:formate hydrogenlyase transcriptional activator